MHTFESTQTFATPVSESSAKAPQASVACIAS